MQKSSFFGIITPSSTGRDWPLLEIIAPGFVEATTFLLSIPHLRDLDAEDRRPSQARPCGATVVLVADEYAMYNPRRVSMLHGSMIRIL